MGLERRPGPVGGQVQDERGAGEAVADRGEGALPAFPGGAFARPQREVRVLDRQGFELRRAVPGVGTVGLDEFAHQDGGGPAVEGDVVDDDLEQPLLVADREQRGGQQPSGDQVEPGAGVPEQGRVELRRGPGGTVLHGTVLQGTVLDGHRDRPGGDDALARPLGPGDESGAQRLVAVHDRGQRTFQGGVVHGAADPDRDGDVEGGVARVELVLEVEALLRRAERDQLQARVAGAQPAGRVRCELLGAQSGEERGAGVRRHLLGGLTDGLGHRTPSFRGSAEASAAGCDGDDGEVDGDWLSR